MIDLFNYSRRNSSVAHAGTLNIGGDNPVRVQSMTTTDTNDTDASVAQAERIIDAGGELVRLTTQGRREAENLKNISGRLKADGYRQPICADVHFNANVADIAALYAEKVRINPGNYVDPARTFRKLEYTDEEYAHELKKIEDRLTPFIKICKEHHTCVRIGVNHGSLSDRIRNRYGDTPEGIVESCMEFLRIFKKQDFNDVVISIKASNTVVMVQSVRLLVAEMDKEDMHYPLHLGVTEAGEGEDGRIKSAVGIGALLADGIGDTIRVSLSEEPENEIPVARHLVWYMRRKQGHILIPGTAYKGFDWLHPLRRKTHSVGNIGGDNAPVVVVSRIPDVSPDSSKVAERENVSAPDKDDSLKPDYIYVGSNVPEHPVKGQKYIIDFNVYEQLMLMDAKGTVEKDNTDGFVATPSDVVGKTSGHCDTSSFFPIYPVSAMPLIGLSKAPLKFLVLQFGTPAEEYLSCLKAHPEVVVICTTRHQNRLGDQRALVHEMMSAGVENPVIFAEMYDKKTPDELSEFQIESAADMGALMMDGLTDGLWLMNDGGIPEKDIVDTAFSILQAGRLRMVKTEYISCPGCGRTLYDLRKTIARIKAATKGMTGLKIGVMGCIVNGPGEMADADYGYVGAGPGKVSLYRKKECVEHNIPEDEAVEHLLRLIKETQV